MSNMQIYLTTESYRLPQGGAPGCFVAHMDYSIGPGKRLLRTNRARAFSGGLIVITDQKMPAGDEVVLGRELARECLAKGYKGVVADFEVLRDEALISAISSRLKANNLTLYVPESCGELAPDAKVLITTALSGGSLSARLAEACDKYGPDRVALDIERLSMDFTLPSPTGLGTPIDRTSLEELLEKRRAQTFFSNDLCAYYFTYSENGQHHFVLYDTAASIRKKMQVGFSLGITDTFLLYSEVDDILKQITGA